MIRFFSTVIGLVSIFTRKKSVPGSSNKQPTFVVRSIEQGYDVLMEPDIVSNWKKSLRVRPKNSIAVLVPCAATKPFPESPSHKHGYLKALEGKSVDVYIVSEPLGIVPYAWSNTYPNNDYDFPPKYVKDDTRTLLIERFQGWFDKVAPKYDKVYAALPGHHMSLIDDSRMGIDVQSLTISDCRDMDACGTNIFRATSGQYVDFLKNEIPEG